jgi:hypothetical protein
VNNAAAAFVVPKDGGFAPEGEVSVNRRSIVAVLAAVGTVWLAQNAGGANAQQAKPTAPPNELDAFMARVLERRNENWKTLHDYILSESETFQILGPGDIPLLGQRREFNWFIREGYLVRSPVKANGATLGDQDRRKYEADWLDKEKKRDQRAKEHAATKGTVEAEVVAEIGAIDPGSDKEVARMVGGEPRFISEAYFMKFPFEPGNYYLAGRETLDGRAVVKVEYYPSKLFKDDEEKGGTEVALTAKGEVKVTPADQQAKDKPKQPARAAKNEEGDEMEREIESAMNKVTLVTMWIDPQEYQIVRFTFDNVDWGFLPGRAVIRVDQARASMTMGRFFENVWLPKEIAFNFGATFASGSYKFRYDREFHDYRKGEVSARIRGYVPKEP